MPYLYESHMGSFYCTENEEDYDSLYCETCGDSDHLVGHYGNQRDLLIDISDDIDIGDGGGGFDLEYILAMVNGCFEDNITPEEALGIVKVARGKHTNIR